MTTNTAVSSGPLTSDTLLATGKNYLKGALVLAASNLILYDNTSAAGKIIFQYDNSTGTLPVHIDFAHMVQAHIGLFADVVAGTVYVYYG